MIKTATPGGDYSYSFSKTTSDHLISIGDTTRGPGQKLGLNGHDTKANITGLPVLISTATAIKQIHGTIRYDAGALTQISLIEGRQLPGSWSLNYQDNGQTAPSPTAPRETQHSEEPIKKSSDSQQLLTLTPLTAHQHSSRPLLLQQTIPRSPLTTILP